MKNSELELKLKLANIKQTRAAIQVLTVLADFKSPVAISQLQTRIKGKTHLATVYRILEKLEKAQVVTKLQFNEQKSLYELKELPHDHFICSKCNKVIDVFVNKDKLSRDQTKIENNFGVDIANTTINFIGLCKEHKRRKS